MAFIPEEKPTMNPHEQLMKIQTDLKSLSHTETTPASGNIIWGGGGGELSEKAVAYDAMVYMSILFQKPRTCSIICQNV